MTIFSKMEDTHKGDEDPGLLVEGTFSGGREPQYNHSTIASGLKAAYINGAGNDGDISQLADEHLKDTRNKTSMAQRVESAESAESTASGSTFSTSERELGQHSRTSVVALHLAPCELSAARLRRHNRPVLTHTDHIRSWIPQPPGCCWRLVPVDDQASVLHLEKGSTSHSTYGSLSFVMIPDKPCDTIHDIQAMGTVFEAMPAARPQQLEL